MTETPPQQQATLEDALREDESAMGPGSLDTGGMEPHDCRRLCGYVRNDPLCS